MGDRDGLLTRLALGDSLRGTCRHARVKLDLHAERNLSLNCLGGLTCGLSSNTDHRVDRLLRSLSGDRRLTNRLAVLDLLSRGDLLHADNALGIDSSFPSRQRVIRNDCRLKRDLAFGRRHKVLVLKTRTVLDDLLDRLLVILSINDIGLVTDRAELRGERALTVLALLHNLGLTRCKGRVRTHLRAVRNRYRPRDILAVLSRLDADLHYLVNSRLHGFPRAVAKLLLRTSLALSHDLRFACRHRRVVLVLDLERNRASGVIHHRNWRGGFIRRTIRIGHTNRHLDTVARFRCRRNFSLDVAILVQADLPHTVVSVHRVDRVAISIVLASRRKTVLCNDRKRIVLSQVNALGLAHVQRRGRGLTRVGLLRRVERLSLVVVRQRHDSGHRNFVSRSIRVSDGDIRGLLVSRFGGLGRRRGHIAVIVNAVLPTVFFLRNAELRTLWSVVDRVLHVAARLR